MTDIVERRQAERDSAWERIKELRAEVERLTAAIAHVRQRSAKACEILNEFDNTRRALENKPTIAPCDDAEFGMKP